MLQATVVYLLSVALVVLGHQRMSKMFYCGFILDTFCMRRLSDGGKSVSLCGTLLCSFSIFEICSLCVSL